MLYKWNQCVEEMKLITVLINLLHYFVPNSAHGEAFEVQHEICRFKVRRFKETQNLLRMLNLHQIFATCHQSYIYDDSVVEIIGLLMSIYMVF